MKRNILLLFGLILSLAIWCNFGSAANNKPDYWPTNGWRTASPESQGMDSNLLAEMLNEILEKDIEIHSVLVVRNGYIVLDAYGYPYDSEVAHHIDACTQSITSALVGIAIDKKYIKDVNQPVLDFFPRRVAKNRDAAKEAMTIENLLTMTTGLNCSDPFLYLQSGMMDMIIPADWRMSADWVQFIIDLPMAEAPGTRYQYCNGAPFLLSAILQKTNGYASIVICRKISVWSPGSIRSRLAGKSAGNNFGLWSDIFAAACHGQIRLSLPEQWAVGWSANHLIAMDKGIYEQAYRYDPAARIRLSLVDRRAPVSTLLPVIKDNLSW